MLSEWEASEENPRVADVAFGGAPEAKGLDEGREVGEGFDEDDERWEAEEEEDWAWCFDEEGREDGGGFDEAFKPKWLLGE